MLTLEHAQKLWSYNPLTGDFAWLVPRGKHRIIGERAGSLCKGYWVIETGGCAYKCHRLAWLFMTGEWPHGHVDHRDNVRSNNAWLNLRLASSAQNSANQGIRKKNKAGFKGVQACGLKWKAQITHLYKTHYLGLFDTKEKAHAAYIEASKRLNGEYARAA